MKYLDVPILVNDFLEFMSAVKNRSPNTIKEYHYDLRNTFRYLKQNISNQQTDDLENIKQYADKIKNINITDLNLDFFKLINKNNIYSYLNYLDLQYQLKTKHVLKPNSRARKVASIRSFYNYLVNNVNLKENPVIGLETPQLDRRIPKYLTLEESTSLLHSVKFNEQKFGERDYCILTLFLNCGLRLSELININFKDMKDDKLSIIGKGNKERIVHLNKACLSSIDIYVAVRKKDNIKDREALFLSERGERIGRRMVECIVKKYIELAGLDSRKYSPHKLRHTAATLMHKYGNVDIRALQQVLGHETIATTQIYTHIDSDQVRDAIDSNPLNNI
ncbi:MAG: tyrosine recombinase XerC [Clostridia bacterium]